MTVVARLIGEKHNIHKILVNKDGGRIIGIDTNGNMLAWRFNLMSQNMMPTLILRGLDVMDVTFTSNNSNILILTKEYLLSYDLNKAETNREKILTNNKIV
jgi:WD40 repeat protein